ncbi:carbon-nitrogen hydrolase family protein [Sinimarinibacterium flocculans]|uniref:Putative amidohydrolase n=1 Tax=Sinimarinibacterium flocculans TaxID=985250 RepID=A0A318E5X5_9GAMM|nr:carbon-nitrogen hydrolase family protein [Sinimarinibacterium flocculans]PXV63950.1 putative amidohydrolase [Sinimarinibacterium flocculans]
MPRSKSLIIREARHADIPAIRRVVQKAYGEGIGYTRDQLRGQLNHFPPGHLVAELDGQVVGYCASIIVTEQEALSRHTWSEITGNAFGSTHDADGDFLYGYEVAVDPDFRGRRIAERLYAARRKLCVDLGLDGIVFGGRMPGYARRARKLGGHEAYCAAVLAGQIRDPVMNFQLRQGFEFLGVLPKYLKSDAESGGAATHMLWRNPQARRDVARAHSAADRGPSTVRVATVQYLQRAIGSFDEFADIVRYFVDTVADYKSDFVVFPEYFSLQLLSVENEPLAPRDAILKLAEYNDRLETLFRELALRYNVNIIAGSHPALQPDGRLLNLAHVFLRDGSVFEQPKIHPTPAERYWWQVEGGDYVGAIQTDCGTIGVLVCYDSEFPELTRHLVDQGADILFVPYSTEERNGHLRVRYCAHARAVENQIYVVTSGNTGNLPRVHNMDIHYAQSAIITPCDFPFGRDGVAADTTPNVEMIAFADLDLAALATARAHGTVQNLKDRRHDLYAVQWRGRSAH